MGTRKGYTRITVREHTRQQLKILAALKGKPMMDFLDDLVAGIYAVVAAVQHDMQQARHTKHSPEDLTLDSPIHSSQSPVDVEREEPH